MKVKATTSFAGEICMAAGEVRDVPEDIAAPLLKCGYLEAVETPDQTPDQEPDSKHEPEETPDQEPDSKHEPEETPDQEPEKPKRSRSKTKTEG